MLEQICFELTGGSLAAVIAGGVISSFSILANFVAVDSKLGKVINFLAANIKHIKQTEGKK